ncbi:DgyrCDS2752 [Dimorphilus gyrociliatus]|nr:DgyrCDS2752 [Dimorphilus gyrociliatus]
MPMIYPSPMIEKNDVIIWLEQHKNVVMRILTDDNFEHLTQASTGATTGDWLISFEKSGCDQFTPLLEAVAHHLRQKINVATVDLTRQLELRKRFKIEGCPSIYLFRHGNMYEYSFKEFTFQSLTEFAENTYKHSKAEKVPNPQSPFDKLVEYVVDRLKKSRTLFYTLISIPIIIVLISLYIVRKRRIDQKRFKLH